MSDDQEQPAPSKEKKPKKPKRYESESEILCDIDNTRYGVNFLRQEAEICDRIADIMREYESFPAVGFKKNGFGSRFIFSLNDYRTRAERSRLRASGLENIRLKKLGEALATMRTGVFPELIADNSIEFK